MIFSPEARFTFYRKLESLAALDKFWDFFGKNIIGRYLANFGPTKIKGVMSVDVQTRTLEKFADEINMFTEHIKLKLPDLVKNKGKWLFVQIDHETKLPFIDYEFSSSRQISGVSYNDTMKYRTAKRKWNEIRSNIDKVVPGLQKILVVIEGVNLLNSINALSKSKTNSEKVFNFINILGYSSDLLAALKFATQKTVTKWWCKADKPYKNAIKLTEKSFAAINLAGAVCYIGAIKDTYNASSDGKYGLTAGYATIALASTASAASAALVVQAGSSAAAATAFGLSASTLGVIGIGLFVVYKWQVTLNRMLFSTLKCFILLHHPYRDKYIFTDSSETDWFFNFGNFSICHGRNIITSL